MTDLKIPMIEIQSRGKNLWNLKVVGLNLTAGQSRDIAIAVEAAVVRVKIEIKEKLDETH